MDIFSYKLGEKNGSGPGGVTPEQLEAALALKQDTLTAGNGIGIDRNEIRVTYGELATRSTLMHFEDPSEIVDGRMYVGADANPGINENDVIWVVGRSTFEANNFIDFRTGDEYQQSVSILLDGSDLTAQYAAFCNCHGAYVSPDFDTAYLVKSADPNDEQTEEAYVVVLAETDHGIAVLLIISNSDYIMDPTNELWINTTSTSYKTLPNSAIEFGEVADGDERPVNGNAVKAAISGGTSSFIPVVKDSALHYENQGTDEESWFEARIAQSLFPVDFLSSKGKYNLFVVINGEEEGTILGYTANHFCLQIGSDESFFALCYDAVTDMDIIHKVSIFKQPSQPSFVIQYTGLLGGSRQLPEEGSTVSIYLQRLF